MITEENISIIIQIATLVGIIFGVYLYFRKPQEKSETTDAVFEERMKNYESTTEKSIQLALNHSHTVESKIDSHIKESQAKGEADARWQGRIETLLENLSKK
jgi:predicted histidine transporter YuiF (NhaC family)